MRKQCQSRKENSDPADDTDKDLSDVPSDFNQSKGTTRLRERIVERWDRYCKVKAAEPCGQWSSSADALRQASPNDMYRFFNWCCKDEWAKLKGFKKGNSLKEYFRCYYQRIAKRRVGKEMGRKRIRHLINKYHLNTQSQDNIPVYIEDMIPLNETGVPWQEHRMSYMVIPRMRLA